MDKAGHMIAPGCRGRATRPEQAPPDAFGLSSVRPIVRGKFLQEPQGVCHCPLGDASKEQCLTRRGACEACCLEPSKSGVRADLELAPMGISVRIDVIEHPQIILQLLVIPAAASEVESSLQCTCTVESPSRGRAAAGAQHAPCEHAIIVQ
eukprot:scaffold104738_cov33-Tisochrysis_lutea.AAC.1